MECPDCGYMLSAFDKECPRCKVYGGKALPPAPITLALPPPPILTKSQQQQAQAASAIEANRESSQRADLQQRANPNYWRYQQEENEAQQKQAIQNRQESITAQRQQNAYINAAARNAVLANQRQGN